MLIESLLHNISFSLSTLVSEDLAYFYGIFAVQSAKMSPTSFIFFYTIGIILGDYMLYSIGFGARYIPWLKRFIKPEVAKPFGAFEEFLLVTRFIPGTRLPTYLYCGFTGYNPFKFGVILSFSTLFYACFGVFLLQLFDVSLDPSDSIFIRFSTSLMIALATIMMFKLVVKGFRFKRTFGEVFRPIWVSFTKYRRLEFWNSWLFYLPFVPTYIYFLIRHRGFTGCLNANPCLFMGGFIGEKKSEIDLLLRQHIPNDSLRTRLFHPRREVKFPIVLKPDSGLRGVDVAFIKNQEELELYLNSSQKVLVEQEYCDSPYEIGVFYIRYPGEKNGKVFSVTKKEFPFVIGDGESRLFDLMLRDSEIKLRFEWLFDQTHLDPNYVPAKGEKYILTRKGSHSKGCLFKNGAELEVAAQAVAKTLDKIPDFYVGRADVKYSSQEGLASGNFKILELNGAGAESTNIYDPSLTCLEVYSILYKQWKAIFEIGTTNSRRFNRLYLWRFFLEIFRYKTNYKRPT
ncbi:MAG: hypothetical protein CME65_08775 [Halobacteriovoraceae bacterium]|nr:hypothetical protein [Halobacteriovoraceae bacterium]|tara:strand:+ start:2222 stop:3763 length:1542 start_codon:yes stop_codon:yes gene_type:complete